MKKGFTLVELLVVVGIMGLLGTVSVGGYQQMRRGMEEKGVMQDVNTLIRAAYQRAQVDRLPTAVVFWNETLRGDNEVDGENMIVVGHAVAIRRAGRITEVATDYLLDEFGDLELSYQTDDGDDGSGGSTDAGMYLYPLDNLSEAEQSSSIRRSLVETKVYAQERTPVYLTGTKSENVLSSSSKGSSSSGSSAASGQLRIYAFKVKDSNGVSWKQGMAYGMEFAHVMLPHGYFFGSGSSYSTSSANPVRESGTLVFDVGYNAGTGMTQGSQGGLLSRKSVQISAFRLGASGTLESREIGTTADPTENIH